MKLVFFDIECACVHKTYAKICAFGYVVCDEKFNILEKEDLLINPRGRFELTDRKGEKGLVLPYEYENFKKCPLFPEVYPKIKSLLEDKDSFVLGHAVLNDVKYLNLETKRFHLPSFNFRFSDSQLIYMTHINDFSRQFGLEAIVEKLGVEFTPHRAVDDAYATMKIVEAICKARNCNFPQLLEQLNLTSGKIENYTANRPQSGGQRQFNRERKEAREARSRARQAFFNNVNCKRRKKSGALKGETFIFSRAIEDDIKNSIPFVNSIYEKGGAYCGHLSDATAYVCEKSDDTSRTREAKKLKTLKIITLDDFKELIK